MNQQEMFNVVYTAIEQGVRTAIEQEVHAEVEEQVRASIEEQVRAEVEVALAMMEEEARASIEEEVRDSTSMVRESVEKKVQEIRGITMDFLKKLEQVTALGDSVEETVDSGEEPERDVITVDSGEELEREQCSQCGEVGPVNFKEPSNALCGKCNDNKRGGKRKVKRPRKTSN